MLHVYRYIFYLLSIFIFTNALALETDWSSGNESQVRLISPITKTNNATSFFLGLEYKLQEGWKTYWKSPGDGGFPQQIKWENSSNIKSIEILWPSPQEFEILGTQSLGYSNNIIFPLKIEIINPLESIDAVLDINYLVCKEICIPGNAFLKLTIPAGKGGLTKHSYNLEKSLSKLPIPSLDLNSIENATAGIFVDNQNIHIELSLLAKEIFKKPNIFLHTKYGLPVQKPIIKLDTDSKKLNASFVFNKKLIKDNIVEIEFVINDYNKSLVFEEQIIVKEKTISLYNSNILVLFIAFVGGLILNVMPCVLPILSIKLLSMLKNIDKKPSIRSSFFITSLGIISSFSLLAGFFILLRYLGLGVGWGMQFQNPIFLMTIAIILFFFALNLLGFFELSIPSFANNRLVSQLNSHYYFKDFFNGFFATIMATPCSAPFVGTALTAAFTQSYVMMFFIFLFMSLGMSAPYLLVSLFPNLLSYFPKPGKWMIYLKYFLGILLLGTLVWVGNILLNHFNYYFIFSSIVLFLLSLLAIHYTKIKEIVLVIAVVIFYTFSGFHFFQSTYSNLDTDWYDFNSTDIEELILSNNIVFVDITADWCATCQYNKINVLNSNKVKNAFDQFNVIKIKGDWTKPNFSIQKFLEQNNKYGIPFNIIYSKKNPKGIVLSELLSQKEVLDTLNKL